MNFDKGQHVYPEVQAPSQPYNKRQHHSAYEEVPISDRSYTSSSLLTEPDQIREEIRMPEEKDLFLVNLNEKRQNLQKWQRALMRCSVCLKVLALIFMSIAAFHLIFPAKLEKMGGRHDNWQPDHFRSLRRDHGENGDLDFFAANRYTPNPPNIPTATFSSDQGADGTYTVDKKVLQERKITRTMTRASFVTFLMWGLVFAAAAVGYRASKQNQLNQVTRCTFKKSILLLIFATVLGIWKLKMDFRLMKQMKRYHNADAEKEIAPWKQNEEKWNKINWNFQNQPKFESSQEDKQQIWSRKDSHRHLSEVREGRRLRSSFDVFDFVNNAISSGVNKAKYNIDQVLGAIDKGTQQILDPIRQEVNKQIDEKIMDPLVENIKQRIEKANKDSQAQAQTQEQTPVEVSAPAEENTHILQSSHIDANVEEPVQATEMIPEQAVIEQVIAEPIPPFVEEVIAEPIPAVVEEVIAEPIPAVVEEVISEPIIDYISLEEAEVMKYLASMGRLFNDEDEAKLIKLTEDLTAWMNKYAATFDDPEFLLQQVAMPASELTEAILETPVEQPVENLQELIEVPSAMQTSFSITFSFSDNADWFTYQQTVIQDENGVQTSFDFNNLWAEMTKDINNQEDWGRLNDNDWNNLIQIQYLKDSEIDTLVDEWFSEVDPEFKNFVDSLAPVDVLEFTPEEIQQMFTEKTASEFKLVLDKINDFHRIIPVFEMLTEEQVFAYLTGLTESDWRMTTPDEWRALVLFLDSQGFKSIVDYMNADEILGVWNYFDDFMSQKFFDGLTKDDKLNFTPAEWQASFIGFTPSEFKQIFLDEMDVDNILYVCKLYCQQLGSMSPFYQGLTIDDWMHFTPAEWEGLLAVSDIQGLVNFIHQMHLAEPNVVYEMFKNMPIEMVQDFVNTPELAQQFSPEEMQTINRGIRDNTSETESVLDYEPTRKYHNHKRQRGEKKPDRHGKHHKDHQEKKYGPNNKNSHEKSNHKHNKKDRPSFEKRPKDEYINKAYSWILDNEDFVINENMADDQIMDAIRESEVHGESEQSTREDSEPDSSSDSNSQSDSESDSDSDSDSDSNSESEFESASSETESESFEYRNLNRRGKNRRRQEKRLKRKHRKQEKNRRRRQHKREKKHQKRERQSSDETLQANEEEIQLLDLAMLPQASIDRRHGGRHLEKLDHQWDRQENFGQRRHEHGPPKHCMKWILAFGALIYTTMIVSFAFIFGKFFCHFRSYHTLNEMHLQSSDKSVEERNKNYLQFSQANSRCTRAAQRQMSQQSSTQTRSNGYSGHYFSTCCNRQGINEAFGQSVIGERMPNQLHDTENVQVPEPRSQQATYTLDQVKAVLALERERLGYH